MSRLGILHAAAIGVLAALGPLGSAVAADAPRTVANVDLTNLILSLGAVLALVLGAAFAIKRFPLGFAARSSGPLKVVATLALGPKERLLLVDARGTEVLVAVSPAGVSIVSPGHAAVAAAVCPDLEPDPGTELRAGLGIEAGRLQRFSLGPQA